MFKPESAECAVKYGMYNACNESSQNKILSKEDK